MAPKKEKKRPSKLLLAKHVAKKRCAIYASNASDSPLLRLPPEVRNRIWRFALTGRAIHVNINTSCSAITYNLCRFKKLPEKEASSVKRQRYSAESQYHQQHSSCKGSTRIPLFLLRACRQIHQEAALLPYQEDTFVFESLHGLDFFLETLVPSQSQAIRSICWVEYLTPIPPTRSTKAFYDRKLPELRSLTVFVEIQCARAYRYFRAGEQGRSDGAGFPSTFRHLPMSKCAVAICDMFGPPNSSASIIARWSSKMERSLKEPYDKTAIAARRQETEAEREREAEREIQRRRQRRAGGRLRALNG